MKEPLATLIQLQALDLKRQKEKEDLAQIPERMKIAEKPLLGASAAVEKFQSEFERLNKDKKEKELALQIVEDKIRKLKGRLTELKTNKEYHAHLQEIAAADKEKEQTEDLLLQAMEDIDLLKRELAAKEATLKEAEIFLSREREEMNVTIEKLSKSDKRLEQEWLALSEEIPNDLFKSYKRLYSLRKGLAVVPVNGYTCSGCHFSLPPQLVAEVKKQEKILTCNYCNRILYTGPASE